MRSWHPLLDLVEEAPGTWTLSAQLEPAYGRLQLCRTSDGPRYRVEFRGQLIGWSTSLRVGVERVHQAFLRAHGPQSGAIADWGELTGHGVSRPDRAVGATAEFAGGRGGEATRLA